MAFIIQAILKINPDAKVVVNAEDYNQITWLEGTTPISKSDIEAMIPTVKTEIANAETQKATDKASGNQKLLDLGLTQAEATALTGYTPPTEV
jgi:hypothetical protein